MVINPIKIKTHHTSNVFLPFKKPVIIVTYMTVIQNKTKIFKAAHQNTLYSVDYIA